MRRLAVLLLGVHGALAASAQAPEDSNPADHPEVRGALVLLDRWIDAYQAYERVPGISVGVVLDQDLIWHRGYGHANVRRKVPADENTLYSICSISKLFTSIALMQQRDAGHLRLDDPVAEHLPWFDIEQAHGDSGAITIRSLLTHSSGLPRESINHYWNPDYPFPSREEMIEALSSQETLYPAEKYFQYSNLALTLVGEIASACAEKPYEAMIQESILTPLGMTETRTYFPEALHGTRMAIGYGAIDRDGDRVAEPPFDTAGIRPAAGFTSNVTDLARFAAWQFRLLESGGEEVLKASTLREMQRVQWVDPSWKTTWGLGFEVRKAGDDTLVGHGGACPGYITYFATIPKRKLAVIALTNANAAQPGRIAENAIKLVAPAVEKAKKADSADEVSDLGDYEGLYRSRPWTSEVAIVQTGKRLSVAALPSPDPTEDLIKLERVDGDEFRRVREDDDDLGETWTFDRDDTGAVVAVRYHGAKMTKVR